MKKLMIVLFAILIVFALALPCFASDVENQPVEAEEVSGEQSAAEETAEEAGEEKASEKSIAEIVQDYLLEHWDAIAVAAYIVYKVLPKIGGIAKGKKREAAVTNALNAYFGDSDSATNVFSAQKALVKVQETFMNDTGETLEQIKAIVAPITEFAEKYKESEEARESAAKIALATESAVELMANQLCDLVLSSPSVGAKKKSEIEAAWKEKTEEIKALTEAVIANDDKE